ncbi:MULTISPECIES: TVP38/TMEM64 family protein [unclassified Prochlorococcus]|uniref:TVP38/TMEM64 family protein n=1 Tax=unclassified Prochlorococcus TaxID=2627481 RepID=UPI0005339BFF|nr:MULTISPECIES: VTT domain-containing protein [unclassified Prochlorococcus]KGG16581.1 hypothetical protein EV06_0423 [Prochlorococcus sp. MIT 0602]KGG16944.1 hypothetical protein EV07_0371 [Prochlorococcus sp. MIT 0603]
MIETFKNKSAARYLFGAGLILLLIFTNKVFDINQINNLILNTQESIGRISFLAAFLIFLLRSLSILIPILPGTYCSVIAGYLYGFEIGLLLIFVADLISCSCSFFLARSLGRGFVRKILGFRQMQKVESFSSKYLEGNFFLMTGCLMTQFFDFVCYAVGLTKVPWRKFMPALVLSIIISDAPFVAGGYTLKGLNSLKEILNGQVQVLNGNYLLVFIACVISIFGLGFLNIFINKATRSKRLR